MSCNRCYSNPCCCQIPFQLPGPMGPQGIPGPQGNPGPPGTDPWIDAGIFNYTAWQPNATGTGVAPIVLGLAANVIITEFFISVITPFDGPVTTSVQLTFETSVLGQGAIITPTTEIGTSQLPPGYTGIYEKVTVHYLNASIYNLQGRLVLDLDTIDNLTQGQIQIFYKKQTRP